MSFSRFSWSTGHPRNFRPRNFTGKTLACIDWRAGYMWMAMFGTCKGWLHVLTLPAGCSHCSSLESDHQTHHLIKAKRYTYQSILYRLNSGLWYILGAILIYQTREGSSRKVDSYHLKEILVWQYYICTLSKECSQNLKFSMAWWFFKIKLQKYWICDILKI